jgi:formate dehydrogenase subunit gamma
MLVQWAFAMVPKKHDLAWVKMAGGYLSAEKRPIPAHKFNFGQKMWFWTGTLGGLVMGTTGLLMHLFVGGAAFLNLVALVHHVVAAAIVVMLGVHLYMVLFAVKGSIRSMITGYKSQEEVAIMHSLYYAEVSGGAARAKGDEAEAPAAPREPADP